MDGWKRTEENTSENHSKNGCIDRDGKNSTRYCETIEKRVYFYVKVCHFQRPLKHTFQFEYIELRDVDIDYYHTHSVSSIALHMVDAIAVFTFLRILFYSLFVLGTHTSTLCLLNISDANKKTQQQQAKNRNRIIFDEMISIFARFVAGFFVFFSLQDIYVNLCHCYYTESN